ncbi:hypothetical protein LIER_10632 [Lithospermum erythrorhizon]|uniref:C2H2-type domain-containing protein n=1 Tax=Lithospermum erythrorhizon TaxID=34254 RepID=A0AAV3PLI5_LITER
MASSKQKQIEQDLQVPNYLDLNLSADPHYYSNSSSENINVETGIDSETRKVYPCTYCPRKFCNSRALGGHQNAHKRERAITKRGSPLSSLASTTIGIQAHSLIHKPHYSYPPPIIVGSPLYGHSGWDRKLLGLQPSVAQLGMENNYMGSSSERGGVFDGFNHKFLHSVDRRFKTANCQDGDEEGNLDLSLKL